MSKIKVVVLLLFIVVITSCKKDSITIVGKWYLKEWSYSSYAGDKQTHNQIISSYSTGDYVIFEAGNTLSTYLSGTLAETAHYAVQGSKLYIGDIYGSNTDITYSVKELTANKLVIVGEEFTSYTDVAYKNVTVWTYSR